ncbi:hypothetical protein E2986_03283 [Frieseomelitta varia]|uniref:Fanconi-associated nuclease n=1 Tax=Frieseomelitta varia TaxID=561572 RepID=A0A833RC53_9HYME|nr:fanconi-associated nuclease 1-like isoform X1 [Frieseomelitta varia]KAF3426184.1 hypothetical protein E2986_03283 [Frieseomelitta varia]
MSQQTRIDQFYKLNHKKLFRSRSEPYSKKKKGGNEKQNVSVSEIKSELDCMIYDNQNGNLNNTETIKSNVQALNQNESNDYSKQMLMYDDNKKSNLSMDQGISETSTENEDCLIILHEKLNYPKNSEVSPDNINMQSQKMSKSKSKSNSHRISPIIEDNSYLKRTPNKKLRTPDKNKSPLRNSSSSSSTPEKSNYTSTGTPSKSPRTIAMKKLFGEYIDTDIITQAIENMNLATQGAFPCNFDLEKIYSRNIFKYQYNNTNSKGETKYKLSDIDICNDLDAKVLFTTIFSVLSNPINCTYFVEYEFDFIFSIITLPKEAQMLLARMIKRKRKWFRKSKINYPQIAAELKDTFEVLVSRSICSFDIKEENLYTILELLQVNEIQQLCKRMNIGFKGNKESNIQKLLVLSNNKPLFPGIKSPKNSLYNLILDTLDFCVRITDKTWNIIDLIITLLMPNQDPKNSLADTFHILYDVYLGKRIYPKNLNENYFPVFSSGFHLRSYVADKSSLFTMLQNIEKKNWEEVRKYGNLAMNKLPNLLNHELFRLKNSVLPKHVRRFMSGYIWLKILSKSIDAFKKDKNEKDNKKRVVEILSFLLEQNCHMHVYKGEWFTELALIEMHHHKNIEASASTIIKALKTENLTQVDKVNLMERASKIVKKKNGIKITTKHSINEILDSHAHYMPKYEAASIIVHAIAMPSNAAGSKSSWCIESNAKSQSYGSVEAVALYHYQKQGFPNGLHCEGALPNILFYTLFWEELYDMHVPGAFSTPYEEAPNDLFTTEFYKNRKERIDMKLQIFDNLNSESLSSLVEEKFALLRQYQSIMLSNIIEDNSQLKQIVHCLGTQGVIGICKRLIDNFKLWRAGFPDLIVWNYNTKEHKIIEVKGPRDVLSIKQRLWLEYLHQLELNTEVCLVQDKNHAKSPRNK